MRGRGIRAGRGGPVEEGPEVRAVAFRDGPPLDLGLAEIPEGDVVRVGADEAVGHDLRVVEQAAARPDVVGIEVGQRLEPAQQQHDLAHASGLLGPLGVDGGIARAARIAEVQHGDAVVRRVLPEHLLEPSAELGVGRGNREAGVLAQPQLDRVAGQHLAFGEEAGAARALGRHAVGLEALDAGAGVAVERVGQSQRAHQGDGHGEAEGEGVSDHGSHRFGSRGTASRSTRAAPRWRNAASSWLR